MERIRLDVHAHLAPIVPERLALLPDTSWDAAREVLTLDGHAVPYRDLFHPEALVAWMDAHGVERAFISIPPPLYRQGLSESAAREWADYVNRGLLEIAARHPDHFDVLLHLPTEHPALAAAIAVEWTSRFHFRFAAPAGDGRSVTLSDPAFAPMWQSIAKRRGFIFLHPGSCADGRLRSFYLENAIGNPYETAVAAGHLVFSGVLARHPALTVCLAHAGGATAMLAGRWARAHATDRPGIDQAMVPPREALTRFHVDCIAHDPAALSLAAGVFGADHVLFGSDWPFPMGLPDPHAQLAAVEPRLRRKILSENAALLEGMH